jgi:hypothetical protein
MVATRMTRGSTFGCIGRGSPLDDDVAMSKYPLEPSRGHLTGYRIQLRMRADVQALRHPDGYDRGSIRIFGS